MLGGATVPPVDRRLVVYLARGELDLAHVAELPELLRRTGVLEQHLIDVERVQLPASEEFDRIGHVLHKIPEPSLVVRRNCLACLPTLRFAHHESRLMRNPPRVRDHRHDGASSVVEVDLTDGSPCHGEEAGPVLDREFPERRPIGDERLRHLLGSAIVTSNQPSSRRRAMLGPRAPALGTVLRIGAPSTSRPWTTE
jgi:hypothetical protein